jgi:predicted nuclease of restriction endonuclease-like RecB superfamily
MLTGKLLRVRFARDKIIPAYIDAADPSWTVIAERLLELFRGQEGRTRGELEADVQELVEDDPGSLIQQGLAKLIEDRSDFEVVSGKPPEELREAVFGIAAEQRGDASRPFDRDVIMREAANKVGLTHEVVEQGLFADLKSEQHLVRFNDISAQRLLQRYNVALAQAVLLRATRVQVHVRGEAAQRYRQLLRAIKFHRLICEVAKLRPEGYCFQLDGPLSLFTATQKYGLQLALFLPALLHCRSFELTAELRWGPERKPKIFTLRSSEGLVPPGPDTGSYLPPEMAMFAQLFRKKVADWEITEETDVLALGDGFWIPDFRLTHKESGKVVFLEVLGFWRKASAEKHLERLRQHAKMPFLLAVSDQLHIDEADLEALPAGIHRFRQMPLPDEIARLAAELVGS